MLFGVVVDFVFFLLLVVFLLLGLCYDYMDVFFWMLFGVGVGLGGLGESFVFGVLGVGYGDV